MRERGTGMNEESRVGGGRRGKDELIKRIYLE